MNYENKPLLQLISNIAEWLYRILTLNILVLITSALVITFFPSIFAGFRLLDDYKNDIHKNVFKGYFAYLFDELPRRIIQGVLFLLVFLIGGTSIYFYVFVIEQNIIGLIGFAFVLLIVLLTVIIMLYAILISNVYPKTTIRTIISQALFLAGKFILRTILLCIALVILFLMFLNITTIILFMLSGVGLFLFLFVLVAQKPMDYIFNLSTK